MTFDVGYIASSEIHASLLKRSRVDHTAFTLQTQHTCLRLVTFTRRRHLSDYSLYYTHLSTPRG